ncbi:MAG: hypothetical protein QM757_13145 [Paludibaculum sp.]
MTSATLTSSTTRRARLPIWLKIAYTAFVAVLVPVYWHDYGPTNFLYFCDMCLFFALAGMWMENALLVSIPTVGILLPQVVWVADFAGHFVGLSVVGMTDYMFDAGHSLFLRGLSLFHGWLPFLLVYLVHRLGYHKKALVYWCSLAWVLMLLCYFVMPKPGDPLPTPLTPVNINYVYGPSETKVQTWMPETAWFALLMIGLPVLVWWPTHLLLQKWFGRAAGPAR